METPRKKHRNTVDYERFSAMQDCLGMNDADVAIWLGYSSAQVLSQWRIAGRVPTVAFVALEGFAHKRHRNDSTICIIPADTSKAIVSKVRELRRITIDKSDYYLLPVEAVS